MSSKKDSLVVKSIDAGGQLAETLLKTLLLPYLGFFSELSVVNTVMNFRNLYVDAKSIAFGKKFWAFYSMFDDAELAAFQNVMVGRDDTELGMDVFHALDSVANDVHAKMIGKSLKLFVSRCEQGDGSAAKSVFDYHMYVIKNLDNYLISGMTSIYGDGDTGKLASLGKALFYLELVEQAEIPSYTSKTEPLISFTTSENGRSFYNDIILGT